MSQLALPLRLADHAVFGSFLATGNEELVAALTDIADRGVGHGCWLWGPAAVGKTHLLQAVCDRAGDRAVYLPLSLLKKTGPEILEGLAALKLICIDDIHAVAGSDDWEAGLFSLCNQAFDEGRCLVVAATMSPRECAVSLPDLRSRLLRLPAFRVQPLDEADKASALQLRARHRGLDLPDEVARYLLRRSRRDMASLYALLDKLDGAALEAQRPLTIPFIKKVI